jgi:hypothetical protein
MNNKHALIITLISFCMAMIFVSCASTGKNLPRPALEPVDAPLGESTKTPEPPVLDAPEADGTPAPAKSAPAAPVATPAAPAAPPAAANLPATPPPRPTSLPLPSQATFDDIKGIIWKLGEMRIGAGSITLDRKAMDTKGQGDMFILQFSDEGLNGKAAPNRYFGSYNSVDGHNISIGPVMGTRMASLNPIVIGGLSEDEYNWYINRISRWEITGDQRLALYGPDGANEEFTMIYTQ